VQRRFCAAEGGIGTAFLDFKSEQQFLEKIFSFMIPADAAESVVAALETALRGDGDPFRPSRRPLCR
jgi:hypothetical protein